MLGFSVMRIARLRGRYIFTPALTATYIRQISSYIRTRLRTCHRQVAIRTDELDLLRLLLAGFFVAHFNATLGSRVIMPPQMETNLKRSEMPKLALETASILPCGTKHLQGFVNNERRGQFCQTLSFIIAAHFI